MKIAAALFLYAKVRKENCQWQNSCIPKYAREAANSLLIIHDFLIYFKYDLYFR